MIMEKQSLLNRIQICDFALKEANLFLDSHPKSSEAIAYFLKHKAIREQAYNDYVKKYGPLTPLDFSGGDEWSWTDGPWPWENTENKED